MHKINAINKRVLIISDTHIPYSHLDYVEFLTAIKEKLNPEVIIHIGDEIDNHAISFHDSDSELFSAGDELNKSIIELQEGLHKLWPKMDILESNHGSLVFRKMKSNGLPIRYLKSLQEIYETPLWNWHFEILLSTSKGKVHLCHGKTGAYGKQAREMGCSSIQGHFHTKFELTWHESRTQKRFNMLVGCLVDRDSAAMAYSKNNLPLFQLGSGFIDEYGNPHLIPMHLTKADRWDGRLPSF